MNYIADELRKAKQRIGSLPTASACKAVDLLLEARRRNGRVFVLGDERSTGVASHFASHLAEVFSVSKVIFLSPRGALQQRHPFRAGDIVIAILSDSQSDHVLTSLVQARLQGALVISLMGFDGGWLKDAADLCMVVPGERAEEVEEGQQVLIHAICTSLQAAIADKRS